MEYTSGNDAMNVSTYTQYRSCSNRAKHCFDHFFTAHDKIPAIRERCVYRTFEIEEANRAMFTFSHMSLSKRGYWQLAVFDE